MHRSLYSVLFLAIFLIVSISLGICKQSDKQRHDKPNNTVKKNIAVYDGLKMALNILNTKGLGDKDYRLTIIRDKKGNMWEYWFVFLPEKPGSDVTIFVFDTGETKYLPGF